MARANRHYISGYIWHITHRCHKKEFLLKLNRDRKRWLQWLFEAKKRYGLKILNYIITSNHIHLLVVDDTIHNIIPKSLQLIAGRTGQEYNIRKKRKGAFWEDRYHATAIESGKHLIQCLIYIHLNMVRAGVVKHPIEWKTSGYYEIMHPKTRYSLIDFSLLNELLNQDSIIDLQRINTELVDEELQKENLTRDDKWSSSVAVGSKNFIEIIHHKLGMKTRGRKIKEHNGAYILREAEFSYNAHFDPKNDLLRAKNEYFLELSI